MPPHGTGRCAGTWDRRAGSYRTKTSSGSATPSETSRKRKSPRYSPTKPSGTGKSRWSDRLGLAGTDPERVYKTAEIKKLKAENEKDENAPPIIRKVWPTGTDADALQGKIEVTLKGKPAVVEYDLDTDLRDTEQIQILHPGGIETFLKDEVLPYAPDAWYNPEAVRIGYEINFNRHFYKPRRCGRWRRSRQTYWRWNRKARGFFQEY